MHSIKKIKGTLLLLLCIISVLANAQYKVNSFEINKNISALAKSKTGHLLYGTVSGEFGTYDGVQFRQITNVGTQINKIISEEDSSFKLLTNNGIKKVQENQVSAESRDDVKVFDLSKDLTFMVTKTGVYNLIHNEYKPNKDVFYNINEIQFGSYFELGRIRYFRADHTVYKYDKKWKRVLDHEEDDFAFLALDRNRFMIYDRKGLVIWESSGHQDTLYHKVSNTRNLMVPWDDKQLLWSTGDSIGVFDMATREKQNLFQMSSTSIEEVVVDDWQNIWIVDGRRIVQVIDPSKAGEAEPPLIAIDEIRINGQRRDLKENYRLDEAFNEVEIDYRGVHLTKPFNLEFQTLLSPGKERTNLTIPSKENWSKFTKDRTIEYRDLKQGKYTFQLRATIDGTHFTYSQPIVFRVESNQFQTVWIVGIFSGIALLVLAMFFNYRYNQLKAISQKERDTLIQENKLLAMQQKSLQLQMNPHFIFNALNSIQGLIASNESKLARKYLQEFSKLMRNVLNQSRKETLLLSEEIQYLESYLSIEQLAHNNRFTWQIEMDPKLDDDLSIPTMIVQPFVENAIIHGVRPLKTRKGKIIIRFKDKNSYIECVVSDNGVGRQASDQSKPNHHASVAVKVVTERLNPKQSQSGKQAIQYVDLVDEEGNATGTEVIIRIPLTF